MSVYIWENKTKQTKHKTKQMSKKTQCKPKPKPNNSHWNKEGQCQNKRERKGQMDGVSQENMKF